MEYSRASLDGVLRNMPLRCQSRTVFVMVGVWMILLKKFTFSENISRRKGICNGSGWYSWRPGDEVLMSCLNSNAW